jgi:hypothetical protein
MVIPIFDTGGRFALQARCIVVAGVGAVRIEDEERDEPELKAVPT